MSVALNISYGSVQNIISLELEFADKPIDHFFRYISEEVIRSSVEFTNIYAAAQNAQIEVSDGEIFV